MLDTFLTFLVELLRVVIVVGAVGFFFLAIVGYVGDYYGFRNSGRKNP